jgi:hypothetical protein
MWALGASKFHLAESIQSFSHFLTKKREILRTFAFKSASFLVGLVLDDFVKSTCFSYKRGISRAFNDTM